MVAPGEGRLGTVRGKQGGQGGREPAAGGLAGDTFRVGGRVHVEKLRHLADPQARVTQPVQLDPAGVIRRHRHAQDQPGIGRRRPSSQKPPSSAGPKTASASPAASGCATVSSSPGVTWGVSMPISTTGRAIWA